VADLVFGRVSPSGKLPVSFPRVLGQVPIYYNHEPTGRPCDPAQKYTSRYRDINECDPLYEFGYGLSYTTFAVSDFSIDRSRVRPNGRLHATMKLTNTGSRPGTDVAQLYLHDPVASLSQPVRRLRGFQRVALDPGQSRTVGFTIDRSDFGFYDNQGHYVVEPGRIELYAGDSSKASLREDFRVTRR
jgi:beta-glucosidase